MEGHNIFYDRRYNSSSGHVFIIGKISEVIIGVVIYSMAFQK